MGKGSEGKEEEAKITDVPGIGPGIAAKLEAAGVYDLMGLAVMSPPALSEMAGIGEAVARKAIQSARGLMKLGFIDRTLTTKVGAGCFFRWASGIFMHSMHLQRGEFSFLPEQRKFRLKLPGFSVAPCAPVIEISVRLPCRRSWRGVHCIRRNLFTWTSDSFELDTNG